MCYHPAHFQGLFSVSYVVSSKAKQNSVDSQVWPPVGFLWLCEDFAQLEQAAKAEMLADTVYSLGRATTIKGVTVIEPSSGPQGKTPVVICSFQE